MDPVIEDGWWVIFRGPDGGSRNGKIVLVQDHSRSFGTEYTIKRYESQKRFHSDGTWDHGRITLHPLNVGDHQPIELNGQEDIYKIIGIFVACVEKIVFCEPPAYEQVD